MNNSRVLIVIPAYNESDNIGQVLAEIKKNTPKFDILVINDCSTDNTAEIVQKAGINCITNVFNMRYAWAVQTGLKYAQKHNYDYAILMDADGQHIASETKKLFEQAINTNSDIIIGSRYLKDLGYPCPLFRKIGTKFFSIMIRLFTKHKITDPLSGFQCLNKAVIDYYAQCGNYPEYPDANLIIEMLLKGYKITEIPTKMRVRENGVSMHSGILRPIKYMITQFYTCIVILVKYAGKKKGKT
ncbi:glycosyltransferase family 2 protein [Candidatus Saccharibacteria bacterium]|nr:glycosyltransferase family 2 protein [Candidatus Saccharibacteria bacterium]